MAVKAPIPPVRIVLVDDHPIVRERLAEVIQREAGLEVCGEAAARAPAFQLIQRLKPDLAIVDLTLQNSNGLELIKDLHAANPEIRLLVVSIAPCGVAVVVVGNAAESLVSFDERDTRLTGSHYCTPSIFLASASMMSCSQWKPA